MFTPRERHKRKIGKAINTFLKQARDGVRVELDSRGSEDSPNIRWLE